MTTDSRHLGEELQDLLDNRLASDRVAAAEAHLGGCAECRRELQELRWAKETTRRHARRAEVPVALAAKVAAALDRENSRASGRWSFWPWLIQRPAVLAACSVLLVAALVAGWLYTSRTDTPTAVAHDFRQYQAAAITLELRTSDPKELEGLFLQRGLRFKTRVFDFSGMNYRLVGGSIHTFVGRQSALFAYAGEGGQTLLCQMYEGPLPAGDARPDVRMREGVRLDVYRLNGVTMAFWEEGDGVTCVLASDIDPETVVQLAFAKAVRT